jgi:hypothetical protein
METIIIIIAAFVLVSLAFIGLAVQILFKKDGKFPNTHVSGNKYLRDQGVTCIQAYDETEQEKARNEVDFSSMKLVENK